MKTSSAGKVLSLTSARNSFLINQLATPGLGSLMARRYLAGIGQLLLALIGFALVIAWFVARMVQLVRQFDGNEPVGSVAWIGETGAAFFALAWVWALFTSLSLLREARSNEPSRIRPP